MHIPMEAPHNHICKVAGFYPRKVALTSAFGTDGCPVSAAVV